MPRTRTTRSAITTVAFAAAALSCAAQSGAPFSAQETVFAGTTNAETTQTVAVTLTADSAIRSITVPLGFTGQAEFRVLSQQGCVVDGSTINTAGTVCNVKVAFTPAAPGLRHASLRVTAASGASASFGLTGTGHFAQIAVSPSAARVVTGQGPTRAGYSGDGLGAAAASIHAPTGIAADSFGNVYVADTGNNVVRMLDAFGNITTVAGGGTAVGAAGDGGPATAAALAQPTWLATDAAGNLYIAETGSSVIRKVAMLDGRTISTVAGTYNAGSTNGSTATTADLNAPQGIVVSSDGKLYIADAGNNRVRVITLATGAISTVNTGIAIHPYGVALDSSGALYISDPSHHLIWRASGGQAAPFAGSGTNGITGDQGAATSAAFESPAGMAFDAAGDLFFSDSATGLVHKVEATTGNVEVALGSFRQTGFSSGITASTATLMASPYGLAFDSAQRLYIADSGNNVVRLLSMSPGEVMLPDTAAGSTSTASTVEVFNAGNSDAGLATVAAADSSTAANFVISSACGSVLAAGAHCGFTAAYAPQTQGFLSGLVNVTPTSGTPASTAVPVYLLGGTPAALSIAPATLANPVTAQSYAATITASGGVGTLQVNATGTLPSGLTMSVNGTQVSITGTPGTGSGSITVTATDALGQTTSRTYTLTAALAPVDYALTEAMHLTDAVNVLPSISYSVTEAMHLTDAVNVLPSISYSVTESMHLTDQVTQLVADTPPVATFSGPDMADAGQSVTFNASASSSAAKIVSYKWDFGDGSATLVTANPAVAHTFTATGPHTVSLVVTDTYGITSTPFTRPITVDAPPVAAFSGPGTADAGQSISFDASASSSAAKIASYRWDFGDGTPVLTTASATVSHAYASTGTFTVSLTVTDTLGVDSTTAATSQVHVVAAPVAVPQGPAVGVAGSGVTFDGSASTAGVKISSFRWDFGDGSAVVTTTDPTILHTFSNSGAYQVSLVVTDALGVSSAPAARQVIVETPPAAAFTAPTVTDAGYSVSFNSSASTAGSKIVSFRWDFGDGSVAVTTAAPTIAHTFASPGNYTVSLTVTDSYGLTSNPATRQVQAVSPPVAMITGAVSAVTNALLTFDGSRSSAGASIVQYKWDFGDGTQSVFSSSHPTSTHAYTAPGVYTVSLTVTDSLGVDSAPATQQVQVTGPGTASQTITFYSIPNVPVSVGTLTLTARSTSGLPIAYQVSGPATLTGSRLSLTGTGTVTITATQPGTARFNAAAPVIRTFRVLP